VQEQRLADLVADRMQGREGDHRLLEDHGDAPAADMAHALAVRAQAQQVDRLVLARLVEQNLAPRHPCGLRQDAEDRLRRDRLAGARLADQRHGRARAHAEIHAVQHRHLMAMQAEFQGKVPDLEKISIQVDVLRQWLHREVSGRRCSYVRYGTCERNNTQARMATRHADGRRAAKTFRPAPAVRPSL